MDVGTGLRILTVPIHAASEQRATRIFPLIFLWALTQRDRADIAPATGTIGMDEARIMRAVLVRVMRLHVVGVLGLVLRFAFD